MAETFFKQYEVLFQKAKADIAIAFHAIDAHDRTLTMPNTISLSAGG